MGADYMQGIGTSPSNGSVKIATSRDVNIKMTAVGSADPSTIHPIFNNNRVVVEFGGTGQYTFEAPIRAISAYGKLIDGQMITTPAGAYFNADGSAIIDSGGNTIYPAKVVIGGEVVTASSVAVKTPPTKTTYTAGENLDLSGPVVTLNKSNGTTEDVAFADFAAKGLTVAPASGTALTTANTEVVITHTDSGKTATQVITVNAGTPDTCFTMNGAGNTITDYSNDASCPKDVNIPETIAGKTVTSIGNDAFHSNQLTSVTFDSDTTSIGKDAFNYQGGTPLNGLSEVSTGLLGTWTRVSNTWTKTEAPVIVDSIAIKTAPTKTTYTTGEALDLAGLIVTLTKSDNSKEDVAFANFAAKGLTVAPANGTALATTNTAVTITHTASGQITTQSITVVNPATSQPIYRFWSDTYKGHFFTINQAEKEQIEKTYPKHIWKYEGIAWYANPTASTGLSPIYRFWSDAYKGHFFTDSAVEKASIEKTYPKHIWRYEGIAYYVGE